MNYELQDPRPSKAKLTTFFLLAFLLLWGTPWVMTQLGLIKPPPKKPPAVADAKKDEGKKAEAAPAGAAEPGAAKAEAPKVEAAKPDEVPALAADRLALGSDEPSNPGRYRFKLQLTQRGASVDELSSAVYDAERGYGDKVKRPLVMIQSEMDAPPPLGVDILSLDGEQKLAPSRDDSDKEERLPLYHLAGARWKVVGDGAKEIEGGGQEISFETTFGEPAVTATKTYRVRPDTDGFEMAIGFRSDREARIEYRLISPYGLPIEGAWYATTFRDFVFGGLNGGNSTKVESRSASDVDWYYGKGRDYEERFQARPLAFAGIENRYFATYVAPAEVGGADKRIDQQTVPIVIRSDRREKTKSRIAAEVDSLAFEVGPNRAVSHNWRVYTGPKATTNLAAFGPPGAEDLASFRAGIAIPFAGTMAKYVIAPLLNVTYKVTAWVSGLFGGQKGNWGIAIILLTCCIRLALFPLSRKQAFMAKKMQDLQPLIKGIQDKYRKGRQLQELSQEERLQMQRDMFALQKRHGVSIFGSGCLPALIQLPILVGLWQALNNAVDLRQSPFLYISNLAAPDMLFPWPWGGEVPFLGPYFNLLPLLVVSLMLVQTKLFTPPATTPEQEMQQKMFKYMMVFMAVMFYKVPSGLGVYFITSSLWSIGERLFVNWLARRNPVDIHAIEAEALKNPVKSEGGWLSRMMEAAANDPTVRNNEGSQPATFKDLVQRAREAKKEAEAKKAAEHHDREGRRKEVRGSRRRGRGGR